MPEYFDVKHSNIHLDSLYFIPKVQHIVKHMIISICMFSYTFLLLLIFNAENCNVLLNSLYYIPKIEHSAYLMICIFNPLLDEFFLTCFSGHNSR